MNRNAHTGMLVARTSLSVACTRLTRSRARLHLARTLCSPSQQSQLRIPIELIREQRVANFCFQPSSEVSTARSSAQALQIYLEEHLVPTENFGSPGTKTVAELYDEVAKGESVLSSREGRVLRLVQVVNVYVRNNQNQVLEEEFQIRPDGAKRQRGLPVAEKLLAGERWQEAVARAIQEELGPALPSQPQVQVLEETYELDVETTESHSYPGLQTRYHCHRVEAMVEGLPTSERFVTTEQRAQGVLQNHWRWRPYYGRCYGKQCVVGPD